MRKFCFSFVLVMLSLTTFGQQWVAIKSDAPSTIQTTLVSSSENQITVNLQVPGFYAFEVDTPRGEASIISVPKTVSTAAAGEPDLPMIAVPCIVSDQQHYSIRVIDAQYTDFQMEIAPSKGDFPRSVNPEDVPYTYGEAYSTNAFFPAQNVNLYEPYILRDFRGQNMVVYPFAYNPISKTLRVYYNMTVEMFSDGMTSKNQLPHRSNEMKMDPEIKAVYANHFINYSESLDRYTPIDETGELLIICHDDFVSAMQPFVNWKKQIGRPTTIVGTSVVGTTDSAIKSYIQNHYSSNPNLSHVLLVGDVAQIPGHNFSATSWSGKSDNWYGQITGDDMYNELIIGRFSAENATQVTTQVNKVIHYERDINASDTWLTNGCGIAASAGNGGHFGEDDWQHVDNIRTNLLNYGYSTVYQEYYNTPGYSSTTQQISTRVNSGVSIINYCNHGTYTAWQSHSPWYSNSHVNALTNDNMLPVIFSVACLVGKYDHNEPCFGETWLRATNNSNGNPTGAIAGMFSYISQPWIPPMYGQDEMIDVLVENYSNNIKRTMGGISYDGNMKILDQYGPNNSQAIGTYMAWILYGDPTLTVRNAIPTDMNVTHAPSMSTSATSFTVNATNGDGALATLTLNGEILGSANIENGTANITFTAPGTPRTATLTVFGYNKITYIGSVDITSGSATQYTINVSADPVDGGVVAGGGTYQEGESCTVSASANTGFVFNNWTENGIVVSNRPEYNFTVNGNRSLVANFSQQQFTITVIADPNNGGTVTGGGTYTYGQTCTLGATPNEGYVFENWTKDGIQVSALTPFTFTVTESANYVANFQEFICETPTNVVAEAINYTDIYINWDDVSTAFAYDIYRNGTRIASDYPYVGQYYDTELPYGEYCYTIVAKCGSGDSNPSEEACAVLNIPCNAPANFTAEYVYENESDFGVSLHWNSTAPIYPEYFHLYKQRNTTEYELVADLLPEGSTYSYFDETETGTYSYMLTAEYHFDGQICISEAVYAMVEVTDVNETSLGVNLYPNPARGEFTLEGEGLSYVRIVNAYGQTVYNADLEGNQVRIDLSQMAKGIYMMHIEAEGGQAVRKIVVE